MVIELPSGRPRQTNQYTPRRPAVAAAPAPLEYASLLDPVCDSASAVDTPPAVLKRLARSRRFEVRFGVARNPSTPPEVLIRLSRDRDGRICQQVAFNQCCPPHVLRDLSRRPGMDVAVAGNPSCPPDALVWMARHAVKWFHQDAISELDQAYKDTDKHIACRIVRNPACPPEVLVQALQVPDPDESAYAWIGLEPGKSVKVGVASNPSCPPDVLVGLLQDGSSTVRRLAAANPSLPRAVLALWQLAH